MDARQPAGLIDLMRFALGLVILFVVGAFVFWGLWNLYRPKKRGPGLKIRVRKNSDSRDENGRDDDG